VCLSGVLVGDKHLLNCCPVNLKKDLRFGWDGVRVLRWKWGGEFSVRCKYREMSARTRSSGRISHETAPITDHFEVNGVAITEKLIHIYR
jgi:hypothetical protein